MARLGFVKREDEFDPVERALGAVATPVEGARMALEVEIAALAEIEPSTAVIRRIIQPKPSSVRGAKAYLDGVISDVIRREEMKKAGKERVATGITETLMSRDSVAFLKFVARSEARFHTY